MTLLLSLLGLGSIGGALALTLIPGAAKAVAEAAGMALDWALKHKTAVLVAILVVVAGLGWHGRFAEAARADREHTARLAERNVWAEADRINHATIERLIATLNDQTASIERWYRASKRQQADATKALAEAKAKGAKLRDKADALEAAAPGIKSDCKTPREVLDMKGDI